MTDEQTYDTAFWIVNTYPNLNIADVNLIFKNAKLGRFGKIYDRLDGQIILEWFELYFNQRCESAADRSVREAEKLSIRVQETPDRVQKLVTATFKEKR